MNWILTTILAVVLVEFVVRLPLIKIISDIQAVSLKAVNLIRSQFISDHWKEKALLVYSGALLKSTLKLAGLLIAIVVLAIAVIIMFNLAGLNIISFITSMTGIGFSIIVAIVYVFLRNKFAKARL